jgi:hypothetical protein
MRAVRRWILMAMAVLALAGVVAASAGAAGSVAKPIDVRAVRKGKTIRVTWRTARPAAHTSFAVAVFPLTASPRDYVRSDGNGRKSFSATLRPTNPRVRRVAVYATDDATQAHTHVTVTVR